MTKETKQAQVIRSDVQLSASTASAKTCRSIMLMNRSCWNIRMPYVTCAMQAMTSKSLKYLNSGLNVGWWESRMLRPLTPSIGRSLVLYS